MKIALVQEIGGGRHFWILEKNKFFNFYTNNPFYKIKKTKNVIPTTNRDPKKRKKSVRK